MTCRRPTVSVRMEVLERLARANSEPGAPDSMEYAPVSWKELDRNSFNEGLSDLLAYQEERVRESERQKLEELEHKARRRAEQRDLARKWEKQQMEQKRSEAFERRLQEAKERAAEQAQDELSDRRALFDSELRIVAHENAWEREVTEANVQRKKKKYARIAQGLALAAALVGVVWTSALDRAKTQSAAEVAELWQAAESEQASAQKRVAELESEIQRRVNLTEEERAWLDDELAEARADLDATNKELEEIDRRRPVERPSKMARAIEPVKSPAPKSSTGSSPKNAGTSDSSVRVATDEAPTEGCLAYDPLCFDL